MRKIFFLTMSMILLTLTSCTQNKSEKTLKLQNVSISGDAKDYFKVVDGDYQLKVVGEKVVIALKLQNSKTYENGKPELGNLSLIPLDMSGVAIPDIGLDFHPATMSDWDKINELLTSEPGKTVTVSFEWSYFGNKEVIERIMKDTENIEITQASFTNSKVSKITDPSDVENNSLSAEGSEDWDIVLDDYENYVDQYIQYFQKASQGDMTALTEYPALMEKAQNLETSLKSAQDNNNLSPEQMKRMLAIQQKMMNAAIDMQTSY